MSSRSPGKLPASICIATPAYEGTCKMGYVESLLALAINLMQAGVGLHFTTSKGAMIVPGRNLCVDYFLNKTNATHLLFIDSDMTWRTNDMLRLLGYSELDVVGAMCPRKDYDWNRIAQIARTRPEVAPADLPLYGARQVLDIDVSADDIIEVSALGTGIMLIRRETFDALRHAHPEWLQAGHGIHAGTFAYFGGARNANGVGEDVTFCADVRALGKKVYACPWLRIGHIGNHEFVGQPTVTMR